MQNALELPTRETAEAAVHALHALRPLAVRGDLQSLQLHLQPGGTTTVSLPTQAVKLLIEILGQLANGNAVTIVPVHAELTTQQAAELLNVSRPFLIKLLEDDVLPYSMVGSHRRVKASDVIAYKQSRERRTRDAVKELADLGQDMGT